MNQIFNYFHIIRPLNVLLSGLSVFIAAYLLNGKNYHLIFIISIVVMSFCICANIINDLFDINTDKINHPQRTIILLQNTKYIYSLLFLLFMLGTLLSIIYFHFYANLFLSGIIFLIIIYTPLLKGVPLLGNMVISFIISSVFIFTDIILTYHYHHLLYPVLLSFFLMFIREIIKDIADIPGDEVAGVTTFPILFGIDLSKFILLILTTILIICSIYPYYISIFNFNYLILLILLVQIPLIGCIFYLWKNPNSKSCAKLTIITKYITIGGIITILSTKLLS